MNFVPRSTKRFAAGALLGLLLAYTSDLGLVRSSWDALLQKGLGVDVTFRYGPALAGALVVAEASGVFVPRRFGVELALSGGRWAVWRQFWLRVLVGTTLVTLGAYLGTFVGGALVTGTIGSAESLSEGLGNWTGSSGAFVVLGLTWNLVTTCVLVVSMASIGMAFRGRVVAAALPALVGLVISTAPELRLGLLLDWTDKLGVYGPPTTTWISGITTLIVLPLIALWAVRHLAVRQRWVRRWQ